MDIGVVDNVGIETTERQVGSGGGLREKLTRPSNLLSAVVLVIAAVIVSWIVYTYAVPHKTVDSSGVVIETNTPENTVTAYYELISRGRYEPAARLQTKESQKVLTALKIKTQNDQVGMETARLSKVYDAVSEENLAVVGIIRVAKFPGNSYETPVAGITVLSNGIDNEKWEIVSSLEEIPKADYLNLFEILVKLDTQMLKTDLSGFSEKQVSMINQQLHGMESFHKEQMKEYKDYLKSQEKKKPAKGK